ncbi:hypothetical protein FALBO_14541 [Fusarium albosuccineum]|uniref:Duf1665 domain containing protein n=1 Tax=Fusarium albosuccineum TaxID=1237068 RepID=A0A8H4P644_9HYPO|nr:hypothetical protein FALBO_14541 [Fusarium albosuccineum]
MTPKNDSQKNKLLLPGFGRPLNYTPDGSFPYLVGNRGNKWKAATLTIREVCMLKLMEDITNKPEWWRKINDSAIADKWAKEAIEMPWSEYRDNADFTQEMAEACMKELRQKEEIYEETGLIPVMDYSSCAIKSDKLIPEELREALKAAVAPLENVPDDQKDWHPGSDGKVLDIVHPSLWPLLYGRSRILSEKRINVDDCLKHCGMGTAIPNVPESDLEGSNVRFASNASVETLSSRFQWLPCDVDLTGEHPRIDSYINNLHPVQHAALYPIIEQFIEKTLPAWDVVYNWHQEFQVQRLETTSVGKKCMAPEICEAEGNYGCYPHNRPLNEDEPARQEYEQYEDWYDGSDREKCDREWFYRTHPTELPEPKTELNHLIQLQPKDVKTSGFFNKASRIQVIVKLANIHLTPEKPTYDGGSWHIEGQLNEHICSTALYYYDCDNITDCTLDFRTPANEEDLMMELDYEQSDHDSIMRTFAIRSEDDTLQDIGSVLTRQDRMLFFPNVYQHHVSPFELVDKTRPGHRKILAMFLVDPAVPIISTANVPPQQQHWWAENATPGARLGKLPPEVTDMVVRNMDFPITLAEAKKIREQLMAERTVLQERTNNKLRTVEWNFCEH